MDYIRTCGNKLTENGHEVFLRGIGVGSWLNIEHYGLGIPGWDADIREAFQEACPGLTERFTAYFFTEQDALFLRSLGIDFIRVPINHHLFLDEETGERKTEGLEVLRTLVQICEKTGLRFLLDLHTTPGGQNPDWHSECQTGHAEFWHYKVFRDMAADILKMLAREFKDTPELLGYDILNEPVVPKENADILNTFYRQAVKAIREEDDRHIIFLEGDFFAMDFSRVALPDDHDLALALHFYPGVWNPEIETLPEDARQSEIREALKKILDTIPVKDIPLICGETGFEYHAADTKIWNSLSRHVLDALEENGISWCLWNYKDSGTMGLVSPGPDTEWQRLFGFESCFWDHHVAEATGYKTADAADSLLSYSMDDEEKYALQFAVRAQLRKCDVKHILKPRLRSLSDDVLKHLADGWKLENCCVCEDIKMLILNYTGNH